MEGKGKGVSKGTCKDGAYTVIRTSRFSALF
jgi:hypothetical protein